MLPLYLVWVLNVTIVHVYGTPLLISNLPRRKTMKPPIFLLAGDSTTAIQSSGGGGWGDGFLNTTLFNGECETNYGHDGATTVSFRAGGDWDNVLERALNSSSHYDPYITIQFGHNDQTAAANISIEEYTSNLEQFVHEARDAGATPILVTPLSRRNYDNSTGTPSIIQDLANQTVATISAAENSGATWLNLNAASTDYLNRIGPTDAYTYNLISTDHTHLNSEGSIVFGNLVADLILGDFVELGYQGYIQVRATLTADFLSGKYFYPQIGDQHMSQYKS
jgi:lysophospholipase L1-like esterase